MFQPQNATLDWARYYTSAWGSIPIVLHYVAGWDPEWNPDIGNWEHKPRCSCKQGSKCSNPGKHPVVGWKLRPMDTPNEGLQTAAEILAQYPSGALALRTGPESNLLVIDIDIRPNKRGDRSLSEALERYDIPLEPFQRTLTQVTGSGGLHYIFRYPADRKIPTKTDHPALGAGVDVKGEGGMFNVAPSLHKNGRYYYFPDGDARPERILEAPEGLIALIEKKQSSNPFETDNARLEVYTPTPEDLSELAHKLRTQRKSRKLKDLGANLDLVVKGEAIFPEGSAHDGFRDMAFQIANEWPYFDTETLLEVFRPAVEARLRERPDASTGLDNLRDSFDTAKRKAREFWHSWAGQLERDGAGNVRPNTTNFLNILRNEPEIKDRLYYDSRLKAIGLDRAVGDMEGVFPRALEDVDFTFLIGWLEKKFHLHITRRRDVIDACTAVAEGTEKRDNFERWVRSRPAWDGYPRLEQLMQTIGGAPDDEWTRTIVPVWFRGFVQRILSPGFKNDTMLILEGPQGYRKSSFFKALLPSRDLFNDSLHRLVQDEATLRLLHAGAAIHEIGDLAGFSRSSLAELKAFLSADSDHVRPLYGTGRQEPRNFILVGSTNESKYLRDPTGARRFLPVKITRPIDTAMLAHTLDQLYAEALFGLQQGLPSHVSTELSRLFEDVLEERRESDIWEEVLQDYLDNPTTDNPNGLQKVSLWDVARDALGYEEPNRMKHADLLRLTASLRQLGWEDVRRKGRKYWVRKRNAVSAENSKANVSDVSSNFGWNTNIPDEELGILMKHSKQRPN